MMHHQQQQEQHQHLQLQQQLPAVITRRRLQQQ
jgi:hypothetical protein